MAYKIASERLGKIGDEFEPTDDVNIEALIEGGFIQSTSKAHKTAKTEASEQE
jgi:hypothetical protein